MSNDSTSKTLTVAFVLCIVCSIIVSGAAVFLKPLQQENKLRDKQENILKAAGLFNDESDVTALFAQIEKKVVDIESGEYVEDDFDVAAYDQRKAKNNPEQNVNIEASKDIAGLKRRAKYAEVYLVKGKDGQVDTLVLPVSGYGLWSTLYGFIALGSDLNTVVGLSFYDHGETPGLGGEVDNPKWKSQWPGKKVFGANGEIMAKLKKGGINPANELERTHFVDGLSGATLTSNGVSNLLKFWFGENGFGAYLSKLNSESIDEAAGLSN